MVIENRDLAVGTKLVATYKKQTYICTVESGAEGKPAFKYDGKTYTSLSSAASAVMGGQAANGWRFWSVEGASEAKATATTKASSKKASTKTATRKVRGQAKPAVLQRHKNQKDLEEGQTRWLCNACLKHFIAEGDAIPEACPEGHRNNDPELTTPAATNEVE